jgi:hypothetical protein
MKLKVMTILFLLVILITNMKVIYAEETAKEDTSKTTQEAITENDKLAEKLGSEDEKVRSEAIDKIFSDVLKTVEESVKKSDENASDQDKRLTELTVKAFEKYAEKSSDIKGEIKDNVNKLLSDPETRELIAPFIGEFLNILKEEIAKDMNKSSADKAADKSEKTEKDKSK